MGRSPASCDHSQRAFPAPVPTAGTRMLLEIEFVERPDANLNAWHSDCASARRVMFNTVHEVLEDDAFESPPEAVELGFALSTDNWAAIEPARPWEWSFGRVKIRLSCDAELPPNN